jgi:hypothetical protein
LVREIRRWLTFLAVQMVNIRESLKIYEVYAIFSIHPALSFVPKEFGGPGFGHCKHRPLREIQTQITRFGKKTFQQSVPELFD